MIEEWRKIPGWNYSVSPDGLVRNDETGHVLKPLVTNAGYGRVALWRHNKSTYKAVHRLVAQAFIDNPQNKECVNHINGDKRDNRACNLEWCTPRENAIHASRVLGKRPSKEHCGRTILLAQEAARKPVICVETGRVYRSVVEASRETGANRTSLSYALSGRNKTAGGYHWRWATSSES